MIKPSDVNCTIAGVSSEPFAFESHEPEPRVVLPIVLDSDADKSLVLAMKLGPLCGEEFVAGSLRFKVTRVTRTVDSREPGTARYSFWSE